MAIYKEAQDSTKSPDKGDSKTSKVLPDRLIII